MRRWATPCRLPCDQRALDALIRGEGTGAGAGPNEILHRCLFRWMQLLVRAVLALQVLDSAHLGLSCIRLHLDPAIGPHHGFTNVCCGSYGCEISVAHFATGLGKPGTRRRRT